MAELKTKVNDASVTDFLNTVENEEKRKDCFEILKMMKQVTRAEPKMWGTSIVGFGSYRYKYTSGKEADWPLVAFAPRKQNLTLYIVPDSVPGLERYKDLLGKLGKYSTSAACLYIKRLKDVDTKILKELVTESVKMLKKRA